VGKHEAVVRVVYQTIVDLAGQLSREQQLKMLHLISEVPFHLVSVVMLRYACVCVYTVVSMMLLQYRPRITLYDVDGT